MGRSYTTNMELAQDDGNSTVDPTMGGNWGKIAQMHHNSNVLSSGVSVAPRELTVSGSYTPTSGDLYLRYFTSYKGNVSMPTTTQVMVRQTGTVASGLTYAAIGLYTVSSVDQSLTLVASTASTTSGWTSTFTGVTLPWQASYVPVLGQRYALGVLFVGTTAPSLLPAMGSSDFALNAVAPRICGKLTGQATLPSTITEASLSTTGAGPYGIFLP